MYIYVSICKYLCMKVYIYVCVCVCVHTNICFFEYTPPHTNKYIPSYIYVCVCVGIHIDRENLFEIEVLFFRSNKPPFSFHVNF